MSHTDNQVSINATTQSWFDRIVLKWPRLSIIAVYAIVNIIGFAPFYKLMPVLLSYPPNLIENVEIYKMMFGDSYGKIYWFLVTISITLHIIPLWFSLGKIGQWQELFSKHPFTDSDRKNFQKIRKKCNNIPYYVILAEIILPLLMMVGFTLYMYFKVSVTIDLVINTLKIILLLTSIFGCIGIISFIFAKRLCKTILLNIDIDGSYPGWRIPFRYSLAMQMILMFTIGIMITSLAGYAKLIEEKGDLLFKINMKKLEEYFSKSKFYTFDEMESNLSKIKIGESQSAFYYNENGDKFTSDNTEIDTLFIIYMTNLSKNYKGKVHHLTGEIQAASMKIKTNKGYYYVGIKYPVVSQKMIKFFIISFISLLLLNVFIFFYFSHSISNDISMITDNLNKITQGKTVDLDTRVPVVSNDEVGDLVVAFNKIQEMTKKHIDYVQKSEAIIREQERLASLGQMIGGIAHNLRTPIMSLAGGLEGVRELISEYDKSIDNKEVTSQDHHAIAGDMNKWIDKLEPYCSYMSDVITTVKEHSVLDSTHTTKTFTIEELVKRVQILTGEQMSQNNCKINYNINIDSRTIIEGNITILLQVINNLIDNSFSAYNGNGGEVELNIEQVDENIEFQVKDYGEGISEKVKDKLFKEMVTTKGGGGTGLGLYISMSRIIGNFQGSMRVESEKGKGTTMFVNIPKVREVTEEIKA